MPWPELITRKLPSRSLGSCAHAIRFLGMSVARSLSWPIRCHPSPLPRLHTHFAAYVARRLRYTSFLANGRAAFRNCSAEIGAPWQEAWANARASISCTTDTFVLVTPTNPAGVPLPQPDLDALSSASTATTARSPPLTRTTGAHRPNLALPYRVLDLAAPSAIPARPEEHKQCVAREKIGRASERRQACTCQALRAQGSPHTCTGTTTTSTVLIGKVRIVKALNTNRFRVAACHRVGPAGARRACAGAYEGYGPKDRRARAAFRMVRPRP